MLSTASRTLKRVAVISVAVLTALSATIFAATPASAAVLDPRFDPNWPHWVFHSNGTNLVMDVRSSGGHGTPVQLWGWNDTAAQVWVAEGGSGFYYLHPGFDRWLCLDFDGERGWGVPMKVNNCDGSASQRWYFGNHPLGGYKIATHSDFQFCIDVPSSNFAAGQQLWIWGDNGGIAQRWTL